MITPECKLLESIHEHEPAPVGATAAGPGNVVATVRAHRGEATFLLLISAVLVASVVWHPADDGGIVLCVFRNLTGIPCMGCGLTRSFCALAKGDAMRAFVFHPLGPALFAAACAYWLRGVAFFANRRAAVARFDAAVWRWRAPLVTLILLCAVWAVEIASLSFEGRLGDLARRGLIYRITAAVR
jgi:hypothetical protein